MLPFRSGGIDSQPFGRHPFAFSHTVVRVEVEACKESPLFNAIKPVIGLECLEAHPVRGKRAVCASAEAFECHGFRLIVVLFSHTCSAHVLYFAPIMPLGHRGLDGEGDGTIQLFWWKLYPGIGGCTQKEVMREGV